MEPPNDNADDEETLAGNQGVNAEEHDDVNTSDESSSESIESGSDEPDDESTGDEEVLVETDDEQDNIEQVMDAAYGARCSGHTLRPRCRTLTTLHWKNASR